MCYLDGVLCLHFVFGCLNVEIFDFDSSDKVLWQKLGIFTLNLITGVMVIMVHICD